MEQITPVTAKLIADLRRIRQEEQQTPAQQARPIRALIIEDNPDDATQISHLATAGGALTEIARTGVDAIERSAGDAFDIFFLDLNLPDLRARDVFQAIRRVRADAYVIVVTRFPELLGDLGSFDFVAVIPKPAKEQSVELALKHARP